MYDQNVLKGMVQRGREGPERERERERKSGGIWAV